MHNFDDMSFMNTAFNQGAFLTSGDNVMVASWGMIGVMWRKRVFVVPVRDSRYTKQFIEKTDTFTISVPRQGEMLDAIRFCGTRSGREYDKWQECSLDKIPARSVDSYIVGGCERYFECKVIGKVYMGDMDMKDVAACYPDIDDKHTFYFGEIIEEY